MKLRVSILGLVAVVLLAASCGQGSSSAKDFLAWSMDQYQHLSSYSAKCDWSMDMTGFGTNTAQRTIFFQAPNQFQITNSQSTGLSETSVSDGNELVEYTSDKSSPGLSYAAPNSIADASSMQLQHPMYCGSLLYKFFAGGSQLSELVDESKGPITLGGEQQLANGDKGRIVKFYSTGMYGHASILIDEKSGVVQSITYDSDALLQNMKAMGSSASMATPSSTTETYSEIQENPTLPASLFKVSPPPGIKLSDAYASAVVSPSPIAIGSRAPDFTVTTLDGKQVKLSSFRGKPVFLDFWATWCPPCRASLPHTQKLAANHGKEITVMAISDETVDAIKGFESQYKYTYPTYRDIDDSADKLYKVESIPTFVTIDAKGNVVHYQSGYSDDGPLDDALAKVGIKS